MTAAHMAFAFIRSAEIARDRPSASVSQASWATIAVHSTVPTIVATMDLVSVPPLASAYRVGRE